MTTGLGYADPGQPRIVGTAFPLSSLAAQPVVTLNDNGGWSWFQDQRALFTTDDRLIVGSVPNPAGTNGQARSSSVEAATYDVRTGRTSIEKLHGGLGNDDHNAPAFIEPHPGRIVTAWTGHAVEPAIHIASQDSDSLTWDLPSPVLRPDTAAGKKVSYSDLIFLSSENRGLGRLYDFYRGEEFNPNLLVSDDDGRTWRSAGRLLTELGQRPYVRYSGNGRDRIDFIASQGNPSDVNGASVRSGYIKGGRVHRMDGSDLGPLDGSVRFSELTLIFAGTPARNGVSDTDAWPLDIEQDTTGRPVVTYSVRLPTPPAASGTGRYDHRYHAGRWTGSRWDVHQLAFGGGELYASQPDYTGTAAVDPRDPNHMFISTNVDPRTGESLVSASDGRPHWEIYEGRSTDGGAGWMWWAVTHDSIIDNIRPTAVAGSNGHWALVWLRGTYPSYLTYDLEVVGIIDAAPTSTIRPRPARIGGTTTLVAGRFSGGDHDDLFMSGRDTAGDGFVLRSTPRWRLWAKALRQEYSLTAFDPSGSGRDSLLGVTSEPASDAVAWRLNPDSSITSSRLARPSGTEPIVADVDGDGRDDILWYGIGSLSDQLWHANADGTYRVQSVSVQGRYRPVAADVDGDGRQDIVWYAPGPAADWVWHFLPDGTHESWKIAVSGSYEPASGDLDGDRRAEIIWNAPGPAADYQWNFTGGAGGYESTRRSFPDNAKATVGDFDGDQTDDIFWNASGDERDAIWSSGRPPA